MADERLVTHRTVDETAGTIDRLGSLLRGARVVALTGAGCSTESGIPDYRGPDGAWHTRRPMPYWEFMHDEASRAHYWARSFRGWDRFASAGANQGHRALARLEREGCIDRVITQNVDGLHQAGGSRRVLELHGTNHRVICLGCGDRIGRSEMQQRLAAANRGWLAEPRAWRPDGDDELDRELTRDFRVPSCALCGGVLKPDVVFFGENVPRERVGEAMDGILAADVLFVIGSSLAVWSGYRFALAAARGSIPIAILNLGRTRGDDLATFKLEAPCGEALSRLAGALAS
ncbi:MAG TPA: NAD-dependent protein deacetylase [Thermoanaerobaculia bacterium]|nr:NAD-dependent protein deacetylase [Thermoanaerobaculia bacterium]